MVFVTILIRLISDSHKWSDCRSLTVMWWRSTRQHIRAAMISVAPCSVFEQLTWSHKTGPNWSGEATRSNRRWGRSRRAARRSRSSTTRYRKTQKRWPLKRWSVRSRDTPTISDVRVNFRETKEWPLFRGYSRVTLMPHRGASY